MEGISKISYFHKLYLMLEQLGDPRHSFGMQILIRELSALGCVCAGAEAADGGHLQVPLLP